MKVAHAAHIRLMLVLSGILFIMAGCEKKRAYLCVCHGVQGSRGYNIDAPSHSHAATSCVQLTPPAGYDSCRLEMHE